VTLDEALNELGIDSETDAEGARRAYLRLLKKRKPEVDREGFMRLREAYEYVKPYFDQIEMFRAIEKAASTEASTLVDGAPATVRIETPAGVVWVQTNRPPETKPDESVVHDKPLVAEDKPLVVTDPAPAATIEPTPPVDAVPSEAETESTKPARVAPEDEPVAKASKTESSEPSIDELIKTGKFKRAARRMGEQYRSAVQRGTFGVEVATPYQAVLLLLRLHEKNRIDDARALEKEFAQWLASTGGSVRIMAGPVGVMWMMARELSA